MATDVVGKGRPVSNSLRRAIVANYLKARQGDIIDVSPGKGPGEIVFTSANGCATSRFLINGEFIVIQLPIIGCCALIPQVQFLAEIGWRRRS